MTTAQSGIDPASAAAELSALRVNVKRILKVCGEPGVCRKCNLEVRWLRHVASGTRFPYDPDGTPHIATCGQPIAAAPAQQRSLL